MRVVVHAGGAGKALFILLLVLDIVIVVSRRVSFSVERRRRRETDATTQPLLRVPKKKNYPLVYFFCPAQKKKDAWTFKKKKARVRVCARFLHKTYNNTKHLNTNTRAQTHGRAYKAERRKERLTFAVAFKEREREREMFAS